MSQHFNKAASPESASYAGAGKRRACKPDPRPGTSLWFWRPPASVLVGLAAIALATGGAIGGDPIRLTGGSVAQSTDRPAIQPAELRLPAPETTDVNRVELTVSRSAPRRAGPPGSDASAAVKRREQALRKLRVGASSRERTLRKLQAAADRRAAADEARRRRIEANRWTLPLTSYRLSAVFGQSSYLWSTVHTGLDFAASDGSPISSVATGTVTEAGYAGSYGYRTIITHPDGTEVWYCHQSSIGVVVGESVGRGEVIGLVGSTGNSTGSHLHLEVRPGGGDPEDPYTALADRGATP